MGAEEFSCIATGETVGEAFSEAVERAEYDFGHAGYTGTIAEKSSYVVIDDNPRVLEDAGRLARELVMADDPRIIDKWGPAGAIRISDSQWLFFGLASS